MDNQCEKVFKYNVKEANKIKVPKKNLFWKHNQLIILMFQIRPDSKQLDLLINMNKNIKIKMKIISIKFIWNQILIYKMINQETKCKKEIE